MSEEEKKKRAEKKAVESFDVQVDSKIGSVTLLYKGKKVKEVT